MIVAFCWHTLFRVRRRMSFTIDSAVGFVVTGFCLIFTAWRSG